MTTTAHEDQFTDAPEPVRQPYDTGSILRRNVADLEIALKQQTERAEAAEAELLAVREDNHSMMLEIDRLRKELARLREQKPALYMAFSDCGNFIRYWTRDTKNLEATMSVNDFEVLKFYAAPVPAPAVPLQVWFGSRPESNGKTNWTAILHRGDITEGITIERSELKDRVRYEADRMRWMIGELPETPDILKHDAELKEQSAPQATAISVRLINALREMKAKAYKQLDHGKGRAIFIDSNIAIDIADALLQSAEVRHD